ncbi:hypothetical protein CBM2634_B100103 [Cupriavidus taiwanensis]|uniref:Uncharacterized protein n=1 Tax=Cupriavidus taiwanensis TaxID=164546 RepID=A0A375J6C1_9BURK|nr:hypothetical protein CBM2634_B100103 [Cupriavidus taiwanensis]
MTRQGVTQGGGGSGTAQRHDGAPALSRRRAFGYRGFHVLSFNRMIFCEKSFY